MAACRSGSFASSRDSVGESCSPGVMAGEREAGLTVKSVKPAMHAIGGRQEQQAGRGVDPGSCPGLLLEFRAFTGDITELLGSGEQIRLNEHPISDVVTTVHHLAPQSAPVGMQPASRKSPFWGIPNAGRDAKLKRSSKRPMAYTRLAMQKIKAILSSVVLLTAFSAPVHAQAWEQANGFGNCVGRGCQSMAPGPRQQDFQRANGWTSGGYFGPAYHPRATRTHSGYGSGDYMGW